jgi:beta-galactosidase/beta-glucuronidase
VPDLADVPRPEYPRPRLRRDRWTNLNGVWRFAFDDADIGLARGWQRTSAADLATCFDRHITVPFAFQAKASGIGDRARHDIVWYARTFTAPAGFDPSSGERLLLHFGAVDYHAIVWVNGVEAVRHRGGHTPFTADVTDLLAEQNTLVVRVVDELTELAQPRGKQYWRLEPESIFYPPTTGIWQTVWLEPVPARRIGGVALVPDVDAGVLHAEIDVVGQGDGGTVEITVCLRDRVVAGAVRSVVDTGCGGTARMTVALAAGGVPPAGQDIGWRGFALWSPENPVLYAVRVRLAGADGMVLDEVRSYAGMRKIEWRNGRLELNDRPYFQRLVLDQGYFPDGLLTATCDADLRRDIELAKALGFNGARKHQKVEDPRWLYWADRLGFLVWAEMANAFAFSADYVERFTTEWIEVVRRDASHPSIVAWVPINESWGVPAVRRDERQRAHLRAMYHLTKSLDPTRPVVSNDGWEHAETDLVTVHDYRHGAALEQTYVDARTAVDTDAPAGHPILLPGHGYTGQPILVTEFGGIALVANDIAADGKTEVDACPDASQATVDAQPIGWGYDRADDAEGFLAAYADRIDGVLRGGVLQGFCYTQLTDVEQEINGLLTVDRRPKVDPARIREITTRQVKRV